MATRLVVGAKRKIGIQINKEQTDSNRATAGRTRLNNNVFRTYSYWTNGNGIPYTPLLFWGSSTVLTPQGAGQRDNIQ